MGKFKTLTPENYFESDPPNVLYTIVGGIARPSVAEDLLDYINNINLNAQVPEDVADLFEVAKGACAYGHLYRPLFTIAHHYAVLAVEAALYSKYREYEGAGKLTSMGQTIRFLEERGVLPNVGGNAFFRTDYHWAKAMRNEFSHPKFPSITGAGPDILGKCADLITALFPSTNSLP